MITVTSIIHYATKISRNLIIIKLTYKSLFLPRDAL